MLASRGSQSAVSALRMLCFSKEEVDALVEHMNGDMRVRFVGVPVALNKLLCTFISSVFPGVAFGTYFAIYSRNGIEGIIKAYGGTMYKLQRSIFIAEAKCSDDFVFSIVFSVIGLACTYIEMIYGIASAIFVIFMTSFLIDVCDMNDGSF
ncbi:hypothetical protein ZEAMMB73_Zm00001d004336 [Zea mays]|nr:hypothetical protein ZEAMMB73_Zm00001d004336 [Zea mays]